MDTYVVQIKRANPRDKLILQCTLLQVYQRLKIDGWRSYLLDR